MKTDTHLRRLWQDRAGNFGIMTAVMLPVLLGAAGLAIDFTRAMDEKGRLQSLADAATLAAVTEMAGSDEMSEAEAESKAEAFLFANARATCEATGKSAEECEQEVAQWKQNTDTEALVVTTPKKNATSYEVRMKTTQSVALSGLSAVLGFKTMNVSVESVAVSGRQGNALSMYLVLDESLSMDWDTSTIDPVHPTKQESYRCGPNTCYRTVPNYVRKMASLKTAAAVMFQELDKADPNKDLIRVGATSYDDKTKKEQPIQWGRKAVSDYVKNLPDRPDGGTDASGAMMNAFKALSQSKKTEAQAHGAVGNTSFERFIVFMTDGEMTGNTNGSWNKSYDDKVRKVCDDAKADGLTNGAKTGGIKIYTIAFMAPPKGKELLAYCSSGEGYSYEPANMTQLVQTFGEIARKAAKTGTRLTN